MGKIRLIIERPEVLSRIRKRTEWSITLVGWLIWFFLFRPLLIIFLWLLGLRLLYRHMVQLGGWRAVVDFLSMYLSVIVTIGALMRGWNLYNQIRFRRKERRRESAAVTDPEMESFFQMRPGEVEKLHQWQEVSADFLKDSRIRFRHPYSTENKVLYLHFYPGRLPKGEEKKS